MLEAKDTLPVAGVKPAGIYGGGSASAQVVVAAGVTKVYRVVASGQSGEVKIEPSEF